MRSSQMKKAARPARGKKAARTNTTRRFYLAHSLAASLFNPKRFARRDRALPVLARVQEGRQ